MRAVVLKSLGIENIVVEERPLPEPGPGEVRVRLGACSLNYRDLLTIEGGYGSKQRHSDLVPLSDAAGTVESLGPGTTRFELGDRVTANFFQDWQSGEPDDAKLSSGLGGRRDGVLAEARVFAEVGLAPTPPHLSDVEAAALPCAGLTAWSAVVTEGAVRPGNVVVLQGTGGVSLFALQFAKLAGCETILLSSSDEKLERAKTLGADHVINYRATPAWARTVRSLTGDRGADLVIELGGAETLEQSVKAVRVGGRIALIGVLSGAEPVLRLPLIVTRQVRLQGVTVGSKEAFEAMLRAIAFHKLSPPIDQVFAMEDLPGALQRLRSGEHFGKVCIALS